MGWGGALDKLLSKLPIQGRVERWKNQIKAYEKEKQELLKGECDVKKTARLQFINSELIKLNELCRSKVSD
jgi:hypothetical protein